jgi:very-short-patch-repair endonuclease
MKTGSSLERQSLQLLKICGLPEPIREFVFHPTRKWRFDFSYPEIKVAIEIEGAIWVQGRHTRGSGFTKDCEKYNAAVMLGWRILRYSSENIHSMPEDLKIILKG